MKKSLPLFILISLLILPLNGILCQDAGSEPANKSGMKDLWGIGLKATTDGAGLEVVKGFGKRLNVRLGYSFLSIPISKDFNMEDISATAKARLKFGGANLFLDYYPVRNVIHLTAGVMQNAMRHSLVVTPTSDFPYGDIMIPASELGTFEGEVTPQLKVSPYLALGFGNTLSREHRISFNFEIGALYHGAPQLSLSGTKMLSPMASENNQQVIMKAIAQYKWYPMISFQLTYRII